RRLDRRLPRPPHLHRTLGHRRRQQQHRLGQRRLHGPPARLLPGHRRRGTLPDPPRRRNHPARGISRAAHRLVRQKLPPPPRRRGLAPAAARLPSLQTRPPPLPGPLLRTMTRIILSRLGQGIVTLLVLVTLTFFLVRAMP